MKMRTLYTTLPEGHASHSSLYAAVTETYRPGSQAAHTFGDACVICVPTAHASHVVRPDDND